MGLFVKLHHTIADGVAGVAAFGALLDLGRRRDRAGRTAVDAGTGPDRGELLHDNVRRRGSRARSRRCRASPTRAGTLRRRGRTWPAWREFFAEQRAPRTSLNRPIGADRRLALIGSRLDPAKQIAHAHDATVNDVVLAAVAGGLRELLPRPRRAG